MIEVQESSNSTKVHIPVNASEAELSFAGYLAALEENCDEGVVYVAAGAVALDVPIILRWISYSGLPEAGQWAEVLGYPGSAETGAELVVEKCFGKSILYESMGLIYIQLGNQVFQILEGGFLDDKPCPPSILDHAKPINGSWEVL